MNKTALILTNEEAMALPQSERPLCFRVPSKIYHAVFEAVGEASMQWEPRPIGVFQSDAASRVAVDLCFKIAEELERFGITSEQMRDKSPEELAALKAEYVARQPRITSPEEDAALDEAVKNWRNVQGQGQM